jgi:hypothetical protein
MRLSIVRRQPLTLTSTPVAPAMVRRIPATFHAFRAWWEAGTVGAPDVPPVTPWQPAPLPAVTLAERAERAARSQSDALALSDWEAWALSDDVRQARRLRDLRAVEVPPRLPSGKPANRRLVALDGYLCLPSEGMATEACHVATLTCDALPLPPLPTVKRRAREHKGDKTAEAMANAWLAGHVTMGARCDLAWRSCTWLALCGVRAEHLTSFAAVASAFAGADAMCAPLHSIREAEIQRRMREEASDFALARWIGLVTPTPVVRHELRMMAEAWAQVEWKGREKRVRALVAARTYREATAAKRRQDAQRRG